jgi:deoxyadenosine/deoxycytidine kinase
MGRVVAIEGLIGAGKSYLTRHLSERYDLPALYEPVDDNPYLVDFYKDPKRWAMEMQLFLMMRRHAQQQEAAWRCRNGARAALLDRSLPGDRVFAKLHHDAGNIDDRGWGFYEESFDIMTTGMLPPRMIIYLQMQPTEALERIAIRDRGAEATIDISYLHKLYNGYRDLLLAIESGEHHWSAGCQVVRIDWSGSEPWKDEEKLNSVHWAIERAIA